MPSKKNVARHASSHATFAGLYSYRFQCQTIHSAPTSKFLSMKNCQVATQERISGDTETVYTRNVEHRGCLDFGGMQKLGSRSHDDTQSAHYKQSLEQNSWINNTLEASRQHLGYLSIKQSGGAKTPSDEPLDLTNHFNSMNYMHQEMGSGSEGSVTAKIGPVGNQTTGIQPTRLAIQRDPRFRHSVEPYTKITKKARELLKKKQIKEQLAFVDNFHGTYPKLIHFPTFSSIQEEENLTPLSPTWPGK